MNNIHFFPSNKQVQFIYITSDEEVKEGYFLNNGFVYKVHFFDEKFIYWRDGKYTWSLNKEDCKKIILTTDQDLINNGVQAIDRGFLEWFFKNISCQEVEVEKYYRVKSGNIQDHKDGLAGYEYYEYKIIIPQEESRQYPIGGYAPGLYSCTCITCETVFMGDKRSVQCEPCAIKTTEEKSKQTVQEYEQQGLEKYSPQLKQGTTEEVAGRMYSEEEVYNLLYKLLPDKQELDEWFDQFKKK